MQLLSFCMRPPTGGRVQHRLIPGVPASATQGQAGSRLFPGKSGTLHSTSTPWASCLGFHPGVYGTMSPSLKDSWKSRLPEQEGLLHHPH